jgi:hypothetical protein
LIYVTNIFHFLFVANPRELYVIHFVIYKIYWGPENDLLHVKFANQLWPNFKWKHTYIVSESGPTNRLSVLIWSDGSYSKNDLLTRIYLIFFGVTITRLPFLWKTKDINQGICSQILFCCWVFIIQYQLLQKSKFLFNF